MTPAVVLVCVGFQGLNIYNKEKFAAVSVFVLVSLGILFPLYRACLDSPENRIGATRFIL